MAQQILDQTTEQYTSCEQNHVPVTREIEEGTHRSFPNYSQDKHLDSNRFDASIEILRKKKKKEKERNFSLPIRLTTIPQIRPRLPTNFPFFSTFSPYTFQHRVTAFHRLTGRPRLITPGDPFLRREQGVSTF